MFNALAHAMDRHTKTNEYDQHIEKILLMKRTAKMLCNFFAMNNNTMHLQTTNAIPARCIETPVEMH